SLFTTKAEEVIDDPGIGIVVEVLGFQHEAELPVFRDYILRALERGRSVVTSDKAVLARFGKELWAAAKKHGRQLRFEACVGGGIPIIRSLTESFAVEEPEAIFGIVNGTCNYILSQMEQSGKPYADALKEAQQKGYAETNPTADVSGSDAEAKLLLLSAAGFGLQLQPGTTWRKGIEDIHTVDFRYAGRTGSSTIKQLAVAKRTRQAVAVFVTYDALPISERPGARGLKIFTRWIFAMLGGPVRARSNSSPWPNGPVRPWRSSFLRRWCRARIFSPESTAPPTRFASRVRKAVDRASSAIAIMFWSVPAQGAAPPLSLYLETSANWRAERAGSPVYQV